MEHTSTFPGLSIDLVDAVAPADLTHISGFRPLTAASSSLSYILFELAPLPSTFVSLDSWRKTDTTPHKYESGYRCHMSIKPKA